MNVYEYTVTMLLVNGSDHVIVIQATDAEHAIEEARCECADDARKGRGPEPDAEMTIISVVRGELMYTND